MCTVTFRAGDTGLGVGAGVHVLRRHQTNTLLCIPKAETSTVSERQETEGNGKPTLKGKAVTHKTVKEQA